MSAMDVMLHSSSFLLPSNPVDDTTGTRYALIVLNQSLPRFAPLLWEHAKLRLCADGGANRIYDELPLFFPHEDALAIRNRYKPDVIKGDMDSIRRDVLDFYVNLVSSLCDYIFRIIVCGVFVRSNMLSLFFSLQGTKVIDESQDQDTTDLDKCILYIRDSTLNQESSRLHILATGALGGRFDHEAGNINVLYRYPDTRIVLLSDDCLIQLLPKSHRHEIHIQSSLEGPHCGLIPIGTPSAKTTTSGLKWDLANTEMRFGGLISTSNLVKEEKITVESDSDLLWTISIKKTGLSIEDHTP
ncbi:thiamine pyrophosphokinase 1 isoform X1 [Arabidopsis lyrata subsp. lyrata]|uniref:thiamine pyrophosphokinase 1 isoform X1 n=1 Tax=Arabidopsis lyrata subsp. lyrata TaxID=81972 RepID=UPI000A29D777|nr:thiamine pyrophosphokinase 1 isoform X1 [Arabidopsis lyrata subsp. lyrata]|eukprot:XP_020870423.1 thiamine pyrophosphokinase 1 isoform X1 [Arabidopsis lyrata subsp. lyrata]